ncbi:hypothetical protein K432DRAFT_158988 [Lepidopterella palustris CBS 459.81]|uniref:Uncharacterized protein n=1 Tax=Lepidopterella palustris CBS 459.81 TaxID=1314670 RepID=A0A8E2EH15_9PEZI|nr:hypothetical protein K432DRAFT_158988 [Lepidopterella palustris CBS 459.81]
MPSFALSSRPLSLYQLHFYLIPHFLPSRASNLLSPGRYPPSLLHLTAQLSSFDLPSFCKVLVDTFLVSLIVRFSFILHFCSTICCFLGAQRQLFSFTFITLIIVAGEAKSYESV